jgi:hypothetical protein
MLISISIQLIFMIMKKIKPDSIFGIFSKDDTEVFREINAEHMLEEDGMLLGMAVKGIVNYPILDEIYKSKFSEQYEKVKRGTKISYFNKMFSYLVKIKFNKLEDLLDFSILLGTEEIGICFEQMILHFTDIQEYEKCAVILDLQKSFKKLHIC